MLFSLEKPMRGKYWLIIFAMCIAFVYSFYRLASTYTFNDYVVNHKAYGTDAIEYQLTAVNVLNGHGITAHIIEDYSHYKIGIGKESLVNTFKESQSTREWFLVSNSLHVWHPPGYTLFLALIYKFMGVSPFYIKLIQIILLAWAASFMPLIGFFYWREMGIVSGIIASLVFINFFAPNPTLIRSEVLYVFLFSVWILLFSMWERMPRTILTALLGIILGVALLVKGACVFIAFFFLIYLFYRLKEFKMAKKHANVFVFCLGLMILPWSMYASVKIHGPVLLCTQIMPDLLAGNNEQSIQTGEWTPFWELKKHDDLYSRLKSKKYSDSKMLMIFFVQNYKHIPQLLVNKLRAAFYQAAFVIFSMLFYYAAVFYFKRINRGQDSLVPIFPLMFFINILLITLILYGRYIIVVPFIYPLLIPGAYLPFYLGRFLYRIKS